MHWAKLGCLVSLILLGGSTAGATVQEDEQLYVRRIVELWRAREYDVARDQLRKFEHTYPTSRFHDSLMLMVADHARQEGLYGEALRVYGLVRDPKVQERVLDQRVECLYYLGRWKDLLQEVSGKLPSESAESLSKSAELRIYFAAEAQRSMGQMKPALKGYKRLFDSSLDQQARQAYAGIEEKEGHFSRAAELYQQLAEAYPRSRQAYLFKAAECLAQYDSDAAVAVLDNLREMEGLGASFTELLLLFRSERYADLIERYAAFQEELPTEQRTYAEFYVGRSYHALNQHEKALLTLQPLLKRLDEKEERRILYLTLASSARAAGDGSHIMAWHEGAKNESIGPSTEARILHIAALAAMDRCRWNEARQLLLKLQKQYPNYEQREEVEAALGQSLVRLERWEEARESLQQALLDYPEGKYSTQFKKQLRAVLVRLLNTKSEDRGIRQREREESLAQQLYALADPSDEQATSILGQFYLAKAAYSKREYETAKGRLIQLLDQHPEGEHASRSHLLLAYCHYETSQDVTPFVKHAELSLALDPLQEQADSLRMNLFAAYLQAAYSSKKTEDVVSEYLDRAAELFWTLLNQGELSMSAEKIRWFAGYEFEKAAKGQNLFNPQPLQGEQAREHARRALHALQLLELPSNPAKRDQELFQRATLHAFMENRQGRIEMLSLLKNGSSTQHVSQALLQLAIIKEEEEDLESALNLYSDLAQLSGVSNKMQAMAKLRQCRLRIQQCPLATRSATNDNLLDVVKELQRLQLQRKLDQEPVHLEAAWDLAHLRAGPLTNVEAQQQLVRSLKQAKRQFTETNHIADQDYHTARRADPQMDSIFQSYLMLYDARIALSEAWLAKKENRKAEQRSKLQAAKRLFETLKREEFAVSNYLVHQAQLGLNESDAMRGLQ